MIDNTFGLRLLEPYVPLIILFLFIALVVYVVLTYHSVLTGFGD